jgi:hypothetical protein
MRNEIVKRGIGEEKRSEAMNENAPRGVEDERAWLP